jgi:hypothetical protein
MLRGLREASNNMGSILEAIRVVFVESANDPEGLEKPSRNLSLAYYCSQSKNRAL